MGADSILESGIGDPSRPSLHNPNYKFLSINQEIVWDERPKMTNFVSGWDVKPQLSQPPRPHYKPLSSPLCVHSISAVPESATVAGRDEQDGMFLDGD